MSVKNFKLKFDQNWPKPLAFPSKVQKGEPWIHGGGHRVHNESTWDDPSLVQTPMLPQLKLMCDRV